MERQFHYKDATKHKSLKNVNRYLGKIREPTILTVPRRIKAVHPPRFFLLACQEAPIMVDIRAMFATMHGAPVIA